MKISIILQIWNIWVLFVCSDGQRLWCIGLLFYNFWKHFIFNLILHLRMDAQFLHSKCPRRHSSWWFVGLYFDWTFNLFCRIEVIYIFFEDERTCFEDIRSSLGLVIIWSHSKNLGDRGMMKIIAKLSLNSTLIWSSI